jgi:hypothetical protein
VKPLHRRTLGSFFKQRKITRKLITKTKSTPDSIDSLERQFISKQQQIRKMIQDGHRVVFVDETSFNFTTMQTRAFASKTNNISIQTKDINIRTLVVNMAVSA